MGATIQTRIASLLKLTLVLWSTATGVASADRVQIDQAIRDLGAEHDRAVAAVHTLQAGAADAAEAIRDAWPSLSSIARKRAVTALRTLAEDQSVAVDALAEAARSNDEDVRRQALEALRASAPRGLGGLATLLDDETVGDRAAVLLARSNPGFAIEPLLAAMTKPGGQDRPALRDALAAAVPRADSPAKNVGAWLSTKPPTAAAASAALAVSGLAGEQEIVTQLVTYALPGADDFATAWRLLRSASGAGKSTQIDRWVQLQLTQPEEWMLRAAAVEASAARGAPKYARPRLSDSYPRVRLAAVRALAGDAASLLERATLARRDTWPMVRAAAVTSLQSEGDALPVVIASVDDSMSVVRAAAIEALAASPHDAGWDRIHGRLRATNEWPNVIAAAIDYVVAHCRTDAAESLFRVVMRAGPSNATTEDLNNAARAIEALRLLGTPQATAVIERLRVTPDIPPTLKMALDRPLPKPAGCAPPAP